MQQLTTYSYNSRGLQIIIITVYFLTLSTIQAQDLSEAIEAFQAKKYDVAKYEMDELEQDTSYTKNSKYWYYHGKLHSMIASDIRGAYKHLDSLALYTAYQSYIKAIELKSNTYADSAQAEKQNLYAIALNNAGKNYENARILMKKERILTPASQSLYESSLRASQLAVNINAKDTLGYYLSMYAAKELGDFNSYTKSAQTLLSLEKNRQKKYRLYESLVLVSRDILDDASKALQILEQALQEFPNDDKFKNARKKINVEKNNAENLIRLAREKVKNDPSDPNAYFELAITYQKFSRYEAAIDNYKACIERDVSNLIALYYLGGIYYNRGATLLKRLSQMTFTDFQKNSKQMEIKATRSFRQALEYLEKLENFHEYNKEYLGMLHTIYTHLEMREKLRRTKVRLLAIDPHHFDQ